MSLVFYSDIIKTITMESQKIVFQAQMSQKLIKGGFTGQSKVFQFIQCPQNTSQISVSKLKAEIRNLEIHLDSIQGQPRSEGRSYHRMDVLIQAQHQELSGESGDEKIVAPMKSLRQQKFKRSTNNSHKKFISVARRWMFKNYRSQLKTAFENKYQALKSTRTYFFIILAFIKLAMSQEKQQQFRTHFTKEVKAKIGVYENQIQKTNNQNLKHFRSDEITDLKFSIKAFELYSQGDVEKSIQCVYKKDKTTIIKKQHYEEALKTVRKVESEFRDQNSIDEMIQLYGIKKGKGKKNITNEVPNKVTASTMKQKQVDFLFPQMFGLNAGFALNFGSLGDKNCFIDQKATRQCQQLNQAPNYQLKERILTRAQNQGGNKRVTNFVVFPPKNQIDLTLRIEKFQRKNFLIGFKPFKKQ